jgi:hypothetical protein
MTSMPGSITRQPQPARIAEGGTGAISKEQARRNLGVPGLADDNDWTGSQNFQGPVTVADERLEVTGTQGIKTWFGIECAKGSFTTHLGDPDLMTLTASREMIPPDESGVVAVFPSSGLAAGDMIYFDGTRPVRIPKGSDGDVLKLVSGVPTWQAP